MQAGSHYIDKVDAAIMTAYAASTEMTNYLTLSESLAGWDDETYPGKNADEVRIAEELYKLITFLDKKGLKRQSDAVFRIMLLTFPERHFAQAPVQASVEGINFELFKTWKSDNMSRFEDCFRMALADSERFVHDIDMRQFREGCIGLAGDLFKSFSAVIIENNNNKERNAPWQLIHQLAWHINNVMKAYNQAYGLLRTILSLRMSSPTTELATELANSMNFFKRNHFWDRIDRAAVTGDQATIVMYIDRLMPMVNADHEKSSLIMLRAKAVKQTRGFPVGCVWLLLATLLIMLAMNYILSKFEFTEPLNTDSPTETSLQPTGNEPGRETPTGVEPASSSLRVFNRAGLDESKPPFLPHGRKVSLSELRYVIFQKKRLEHLDSIELSRQEEKMLNQLWEEWRKRGEKIDFDSKERKKVESEAVLFSETIKGDAEDQLEQLVKKLPADGWKKDTENTGTNAQDPQTPDQTDRQNEQTAQGEGLLNLRDAADIKKVLLRLEQIGYYNGPTDLIQWNRVARSALARFKAAKMLRVDDQWDLDTQQALFSDK